MELGGVAGDRVVCEVAGVVAVAGFSPGGGAAVLSGGEYSTTAASISCADTAARGHFNQPSPSCNQPPLAGCHSASRSGLRFWLNTWGQALIEVNVPISTAYNQWTQFEEFPRFMDGIESVKQLDDRTLEWHANIAGNDETWSADITEQEPDNRISWKSTSGARNDGVVTFERIDDNKTRVRLEMDWEPQGAVQQAGDALGFDDRQAQGDLERFKKFIESRGTETGAWRGEINEGTTA